VENYLTYLEIFGVVTALLYIVLAAIEKASCFIFGLLSSIVYIYISIGATYYYDALINAYYLVMSVYGLLLWKKKSEEKSTVIIKLEQKKMAVLLAAGTVMVLLMGYLSSKYTNGSLPYIDAFTTVFALIATWMVVKKVLQNWLIWIVVDLIAAAMYWHKSLNFTAVLFLIYTVMAGVAYVLWKKKFILQSEK
jgi:nicotinamide mononucleotide transporter